jgi:peptidyl-prolyl cis-trans isomerase B (cyclophilin B)
VSPSKREREYARRRYEDWQRKQAARAELAARRRRQSIQAGLAGLAVVAVAVAAFALTRDDAADLADDLGAEPAATASVDPSASPTDGAAPADSPCPEPTSVPPAEPQQFDAAPPASDAAGTAYTMTLTTSCGEVVVALDGAAAPQAVASTVFLAESGYYDATRCHRLTTSGIFVLQCGDPTQTGGGTPGYRYGPVENAPDADLYPAGTVAMARAGGDGESMGSQFFLVYEDSTIPSDAAGGYSVIGTITSGLDVVRAVASAGATGGTGDGAPLAPVAIESVTVAETG